MNEKMERMEEEEKGRRERQTNEQTVKQTIERTRDTEERIFQCTFCISEVSGCGTSMKMNNTDDNNECIPLHPQVLASCTSLGANNARPAGGLAYNTGIENRL